MQDIENVNAWINFSRVEMLDECCNRLAEGHLKAATLIWKRHQVGIVKNYSPKAQILEKILNDEHKWAMETQKHLGVSRYSG